MSDLIKGLAKLAEANLAQAQQDVLGFRTSRGTDLEVTTTKPASGDRILLARTALGHAFLSKFFPSRTIPLSELHKLHKLSHEWGLSISTVWEHEEL